MLPSDFGFFGSLGVWGVPPGPIFLVTQGAGQPRRVPPVWRGLMAAPRLPRAQLPWQPVWRLLPRLVRPAVGWRVRRGRRTEGRARWHGSSPCRQYRGQRRVANLPAVRRRGLRCVATCGALTAAARGVADPRRDAVQATRYAAGCGPSQQQRCRVSSGRLGACIGGGAPEVPASEASGRPTVQAAAAAAQGAA